MTEPLGRGRRFITRIREARHSGKLPERFRAADVRDACPGWKETTYSVFLPKHRLGNPGGETVLFVRNQDGSYSLAEDRGSQVQ